MGHTVPNNIVSLRVLESYTRDVGRGIARIDYDTMDSLDAKTGDIVEIKGKRRTVAKILPLYPSDEQKGIIRVDGLVRNNAGIAIGDSITVKKAKTVQAERVIAAPLEPIPPIDEQRAIVAHIVAETAKLDALRVATERTIALLKERRVALIAGAMTGKLDVLGTERHLDVVAD